MTDTDDKKRDEASLNLCRLSGGGFSEKETEWSMRMEKGSLQERAEEKLDFQIRISVRDLVELS